MGIYLLTNTILKSQIQKEILTYILKKNQKEFEEEQKGIADNQEQSDPLDAPVNLNPMMKSQNDYTFVVSEQKEDDKTQETAEKQPENDEKSQEFENNSDNNEKTDESNESK